jgi:hypothetical protein
MSMMFGIHKGISYLIYVILYASGQYSCETFECANKCVCTDEYPLYVADCSHGELKQLPIFAEDVSPVVKMIYLFDNRLTNLDSSTINKWLSLENINMAENPLNCTHLAIFKDSVIVTSDCDEASATTESK